MWRCEPVLSHPRVTMPALGGQMGTYTIKNNYTEMLDTSISSDPEFAEVFGEQTRFSRKQVLQPGHRDRSTLFRPRPAFVGNLTKYE